MSTTTLPEVHHAESPSQRLRRIAAAVRVHFVFWGVRKTLNAEQKEEISSAYGADAKLLSACKKLVDTKHEAFAQLTKIRTATIKYWRDLTLPFTEPGTRLIRQQDVEVFSRQMEANQQALKEAEANLDAVFDAIRDDARTRLGRLFNASDYPAVVQGLFDLTFDFPSTDVPDYLLQINPAIYEQERNRIAQRFDEAVRLAEESFIVEFGRLLSHITERLSSGPDGERKVFRDSSVANLRQFFDRFRSLNVSSNEQLDQLVEQAREVLSGVRPNELRTNTGLRQAIVTQLAGVQAAVDQMMTPLPRRRIVRPNRSDNDGAQS